jgi:hypothetical protein
MLSPSLFFIYINGISKVIVSPHGMYADDIAIWTHEKSIKKPELKIQQDVNNIHGYCEECCLNLNETKTTSTSFTTAAYIYVN